MATESIGSRLAEVIGVAGPRWAIETLGDPQARAIMTYRLHPVPVITAVIGAMVVLHVVAPLGLRESWIWDVLPGIAYAAFILLAQQLEAAVGADGRLGLQGMRADTSVVVGVPSVIVAELGWTRVAVGERTVWVWSRSLHRRGQRRSQRS